MPTFIYFGYATDNQPTHLYFAASTENPYSWLTQTQFIKCLYLKSMCTALGDNFTKYLVVFSKGYIFQIDKLINNSHLKSLHII